VLRYFIRRTIFGLSDRLSGRFQHTVPEVLK